MQIEFADRAARILLFRQRIERKGGVGGWIGGVLVVGVVEGCLGEHRLYRVRSVWIARRSRRERGAIVRDTEGSKVDTHPPSTASTHPYTIIRRPPARSFFRRRVANQGLDFSLPRLHREPGSKVCESSRCTSSWTTRGIPKILVLLSRAISMQPSDRNDV